MAKKVGINKKTLTVEDKEYIYYDITALDSLGIKDVSRLPYAMKVLLEGALRNYDEKLVTLDHIKRITSQSASGDNEEIPFIPSRIVLQDFTGVPVVVDLAAMRTKMHELGGDASKINPVVPVDLVIDHSVMVDYAGSKDALTLNVKKEFERNTERYELLKWAQNSFSNFRAFPPSIGIIHQVNLEYLASVAATRNIDGEEVVFPDSLVGTDSHTTMINGIGVLGWGVGGIEAEACMLGQPLYFLMPQVVGFKLTGTLPKGATATDLVLTVTNILRKKGVVGKFVEFFGDGVSNITVEDRATVSNMCPEYGATAAYFPVDHKTLQYLRATGREENQIKLVEEYYKVQGMFRTDASPEPVFSEVIELDLSTIEPSVAGPKRPQDRINLKDMKKAFTDIISAPVDKGGYGLEEAKVKATAEVKYDDGTTETLKTGAVVIAAITSCTNTSNPAVIIGAGLLAKKAVEHGLAKPRYVKSSFGPGSLVVTEYLKKAGLLPYLEKLGFNVVGYGCTTCIGNSGPLAEEISKAIKDKDMTVAAVLSGNRNFEGRVHPQTKLNYLASPPLVVAYALAGTVDIDFETDPIGYNEKLEPVYLRDIWPDYDEIEAMINTSVTADMYIDKYKNITKANEIWNKMPVTNEKIYKWSEASTYIKLPPFFENLEQQPEKTKDIQGARALAIFCDSITTDHISPAGSIPESSDAGKYLLEKQVRKEFFNSYGSRRGNHEVMMRGTFANIRIRNKMIPGVEGGFTKYVPKDETMSIYTAAMKYKEANTPLIVLAGKEYGTGSSRDWAAKGTLLLGVKAVIAESYERIHRSNLIGMGVLPLQFIEGQNAEALGLTGEEAFDITGISENLYPGKVLKVSAKRKDGSTFSFEVMARIDSTIEVEYYQHGGILNMVMRNFLAD
ncbi:aconitate hydratase AcnA [Clostridium thermarum]|uniref:aconitate hydratase AcnA n=1 Tax=Clostridium thermarum TaxID=1716543 RepID=UPI0013D746D1|nr:aconitate hydratase AcnA [Clostridium thermarum]